MSEFERPPIASETSPVVEPMPRERTREDELMEQAAYALNTEDQQ